MAGIDHRLGRAGQRLQRPQCELSVTRRVALEAGAVCHGDGFAGLIYHTIGRYWPSRRYRLRRPDLL